jgi:hypothetical protein
MRAVDSRTDGHPSTYWAARQRCSCASCPPQWTHPASPHAAANVCFRVAPIIRWRSRERQLRVDPNGRNRRFSVTQPLQLKRLFLPHFRTFAQTSLGSSPGARRPIGFETCGPTAAEIPDGWRRGRDSNPRSPARGTTVFETAPFDRSGTSPTERNAAKSLAIGASQVNRRRERHRYVVHNPSTKALSATMQRVHKAGAEGTKRERRLAHLEAVPAAHFAEPAGAGCQHPTAMGSSA